MEAGLWPLAEGLTPNSWKKPSQSDSRRGGEGNREVFVLKKIDGEWKFHRYIFNAEV